MTVRDPNLERVELVATALGPLRDELVFVGGCAAGLLMSDPERRCDSVDQRACVRCDEVRGIRRARSG